MALMVHGGRHQEAATALEQLVVREPFRDELWALLMEALDRGGRPAAALDAYQRARARLAEELGLDPSSRLQALQRRIIAGEPTPLDQPESAGQAAAASREESPPRGRRPFVRPPAPLVALIGRDADRRRLTLALSRSRLVTVVGTGGVGKTRLVLDVAAGWPRPVAFCDLAVVQDAQVVGHTLAAALGVDPEPGSDPVQAAAAALGDQELLLVVDNCEHLLTGVRHALHMLLSRCGRLAVVATSRQALGIEGEVVVRLAALPVGDDGGDAARLFVDRAQRAGAMFGDDARSRELVRSICATLDGLPLAIELAAAMAGVLTLDDLRRNLDDRFVLLQAPKLLAGRERNLRGTIDWSYRLLDPAAQRLFRRVSVFASGFTAGAAAAVCADDDLDAHAIASVLADLAGRCLLERAGSSRQTRYRMLETLRQYGRDLLDVDEATALPRSHARWAVSTAQDLAARRFGPNEAHIVDEFEGVIDDLRVAMRWAMDTPDSGVALTLAVAVHWFAFLGVRSELVDWIMQAADRFGDADHPLRGEAIAAAAMWQSLHGDETAAVAAATTLQALEDRGESLGPLAVGVRAGYAGRRGDFAGAYRHVALLYELDPGSDVAMLVEGDIILLERYAGRAESARHRAADLVARREATGAPSLRSFAAIASATIVRRGDPDAALADLRRAIALAREGRSLITERIALSEAAALAAQASDPAIALGAIADALGAWQRDGLWRMEWGTLHSLMELLARLRRHRDLLVLDAARQASSTAPPLVGDQLERLTSAVERAAAALGEGPAVAAMDQGRAMTDDQAVAFARALLDDDAAT
jgi:predicted ATPase